MATTIMAMASAATADSVTIVDPRCAVNVSGIFDLASGENP
jgi:hypothetical protein